MYDVVEGRVSHILTLTRPSLLFSVGFELFIVFSCNIKVHWVDTVNMAEFMLSENHMQYTMSKFLLFSQKCQGSLTLCMRL